MDIEISRRIFILGVWIVCGLAGMVTCDSVANWGAIALIFTILYGIWISFYIRGTTER